MCVCVCNNDFYSRMADDLWTAVCESCLQERLEEERRSLLVYNRATIYVRQVDRMGIADIQMDVATSAPAEDPDFQVILT